MPEKKAQQRAMRDKRKGRSPSTQAGEFVREEMHHIREGKHGARSVEQAIAIGLSKARQAGVDLPPPPKEKASGATRRSAARAEHGTKRAPSPARSRATTHALRQEGSEAASPTALGRHARRAAAARSSASRSASARKAVRTKGPAERSRAARKAAGTRSRAR